MYPVAMDTSIAEVMRNYRILDYPDMDRMTDETFSKFEGDAVILKKCGRDLKLIPFVQVESGPTEIPRHCHDFLELVFVIDGSCEHVLDDRRFLIAKGDVFFINNKAFHSFRFEEGKEMVFINFCFLPEFLEEAITLEKIESGILFTLVEPFFRIEDNFIYKLNVEDDVFYRLLHLACSIVDAYNRAYPEKDESAMVLFKAFMMQIYAEYGKLGFQSLTVFKRRDKIIQEIVQSIESNYLEDVKIEDILQPVGVGRTRANELFKSIEGETIVHYINRKRVEHAASLLRATGMDILDVALESGFNDLSYFNRLFKKFTGSTPSAFRKSGK